MSAPSLVRPVRLRPGDDLRGALERAFAACGWPGAFVVSGIGSLSRVAIRFAGRAEASVCVGDLEILTLAGTLSPAGSHLHVSVADAAGQVTGGHLLHGSPVRTTAEVLLMPTPGWALSRAPDPSTGHAELVVLAAPPTAGPPAAG